MAKDRDYIGKPKVCFHGKLLTEFCGPCEHAELAVKQNGRIMPDAKYIVAGGVKYQVEKTDAFKFVPHELSARANALHLQSMRRRKRVGASALFIVWLIAAVALGSLIRWQRDLLLPALGCENVLLVSPPARNLWECK